MARKPSGVNRRASSKEAMPSASLTPIARDGPWVLRERVTWRGVASGVSVALPEGKETARRSRRRSRRENLIIVSRPVFESFLGLYRREHERVYSDRLPEGPSGP
jgi:hypothetical protein